MKKTILIAAVAALTLTASPAALAAVGDTGQAGGTIFKENSDGTHLEYVTPSPATGAYSSVSGSSFGATSDSDGKANTDAVNAACTAPCTSLASSADSFSQNGYSDWYMPSLDEVNLILSETSGHANNSVFATSTEADANNAKYVFFSSAGSPTSTLNLSKATSGLVRFVRVSTLAPTPSPAPVTVTSQVASSGTWHQQIVAPTIQVRLSADSPVTTEFLCPEDWYFSWAQWPNENKGGFICGYETPKFGKR